MKRMAAVWGERQGTASLQASVMPNILASKEDKKTWRGEPVLSNTVRCSQTRILIDAPLCDAFGDAMAAVARRGTID